MLLSIKNIQGYQIQAGDGVLGAVHGFTFDDREWAIRYMIVDTRRWLPGRKVLISPAALDRPDWEEGVVPVSLTRKEVEESPPVGADEPLSRKKEESLRSYYGWSPYWTDRPPGRPRIPGFDNPLPLDPPHVEFRAPVGDGERTRSGLHSSRELRGCTVLAKDGEVGRVTDLIVDDEEWPIRFLVIRANRPEPGREVLVDPFWIEEADWAEGIVHLRLPREAVERSPSFDPSTPVNLEQVTRILDYYGRPQATMKR
jgi:hypothetical protein